MKKFIALLLALAMVMSLAACSVEKAEEKPAETQAPHYLYTGSTFSIDVPPVPERPHALPPVGKSSVCGSPEV